MEHMNGEDGEIQEQDMRPTKVVLNGDPCFDFSDDERSNKTFDDDDGHDGHDDDDDDVHSNQPPHHLRPRPDTASVSMDQDHEAGDDTEYPAHDDVPKNVQNVQVACSTSKALTDDEINRISKLFEFEREVTIGISRPPSNDGRILHVKMTVENDDDDDQNVANLADEFVNFCKTCGIEITLRQSC